MGIIFIKELFMRLIRINKETHELNDNNHKNKRIYH